MGRTSFLLVVLGLLVSSGFASEGGTRVGLAAGAEYPVPHDMPRFNEPSLHLRAVVDAPPVIRRHVPLEAVLSFTGNYASRGNYVYGMTDYWGPAYYSYHPHFYEPRCSAAAAVRIYTTGHRKDTGKPDGLEAGLGLGVHQFFSDKVAHHGGPRLRTQHDVQFRASGFVRIQFLPTQPQGVFLEIEGQRALEDHNNSFLPIAGILATLGFRMHI
jgi:hypothetical protein